MRTLQDIIGAKENVDKIQTWAENFGFKNVRIYCDTSQQVLPLQLVAAPKSGFDQYPGAFIAMIKMFFNCEISLINENAIKEIFKKQILENSIPIQERDQIIERFNADLKEKITSLAGLPRKNWTQLSIN